MCKNPPGNMGVMVQNKVAHFYGPSCSGNINRELWSKVKWHDFYGPSYSGYISIFSGTFLAHHVVVTLPCLT